MKKKLTTTNKTLKKCWWMVAQGLAQVQVFVRPEDFNSLEELKENVAPGNWEYVVELRPGLQLSIAVPAFHLNEDAIKGIERLLPE